MYFHPLSKNRISLPSPSFKMYSTAVFGLPEKELLQNRKCMIFLRECSQHREYFDFTQNVTDQPLLNYIILKLIPKRCNLVKDSATEPGSWAGSKHFQEIDYVLYDKGKRLKYLHWAGIQIKSGSPYWKLWKHYRYLNEEQPNLVQKIFLAFSR